MSPDDLRALADRCEAATGPDIALDGEIAVRTDGLGSVATCSPAYLHAVGNSFAAIGKFGDVPRYTASIDAAMTIIQSPAEYPDSKTFLIDCATQTSVYGQPVAYVWSDTGKHMGKAQTPALALCAAALRARASLPGDAA